MRFKFSVLFFHPDFGEDTLTVIIYAKNTANAWNKLIFQLNNNKLFEFVVSVCLVPECLDTCDEK